MYESIKLAKLQKQHDEKDDVLNYESFLHDFESFLKKMNISEEKKQLIVYREDIVPHIMNINS